MRGKTLRSPKPDEALDISTRKRGDIYYIFSNGGHQSWICNAAYFGSFLLVTKSFKQSHCPVWDITSPALLHCPEEFGWDG